MKKYICSECYISLNEDEISKCNNKCPCCGTENSYVEEFILDITGISEDQSFVDAMIKLHDEDPIEYELKMQQFKATKQQQKVAEKQESSKPKLTCPKCGSSEVTEGTRGFTLTTGFLGSGNFRYVCKRCGNKWKPGSMLETLQRANNHHWDE